MDELLIRSLTHELSREEFQTLNSWLDSSEENRKYYEELRHTWNLLSIDRNVKAMDLDAEWNQLRQATIEERPRRRPIYRLILAGAAAACILVIIGRWHRTTPPQPAIARPAQPTLSRQQEIVASASVKQLYLPDSTEVQLSAGSKLNWSLPFTAIRQVSLKGEAIFKVARNMRHPFVVTSGALSTTVLGTVFRVTAFENDKTILIRLFEGSVVVRSADSITRPLKKDVFLHPGQQLLYNNNTHAATVSRWNDKVADPAGNVGNTGADSLSTPGAAAEPWYMFNNQSLIQVFNQLQSMYNVEIVYSKKDVQRLYFIGRFNKSDSLEMILKQIATLNSLTVTKDHDKYIITK
ncbi:MAG TPA: FecR domain-containing protein [Puia sp.]